MLEINDIVFTRAEDGNLISQNVKLELLPDKPEVKIRPLSRGKLQEVYAKAQGNIEDKLLADSEILKCGLVEPKLTDEQLKDLKPQFAGAITTAILSISLGLSQSEISEQTQVALAQQEDLLKKN